MRRVIGVRVLGTILMALSFVYAASAQQRTFVSATGSDGNPCSRAAPCRTLAQALSQASAGGEVLVLDSAGYGPLNISKSVSVIAPSGVYAGISVFSGDGIDITAGPSDTVILRGLTVKSQGAAGAGIFFNTGGMLHIENCVISGFAFGLDFEGAGQLEVRDSIFRGNDHGIHIAPPVGNAQVTVDHVQLIGNTTNGLFVGPRSNVTATNSIASHNGSTNNGGAGFAVSGISDGVVVFGILAQLSIENCVLTSNNFGVLEKGFAYVIFGTSTVTNNKIGLEISEDPIAGAFRTRGNSTVYANILQDVEGPIGGTYGSFTPK